MDWIQNLRHNPSINQSVCYWKYNCCKTGCRRGLSPYIICMNLNASKSETWSFLMYRTFINVWIICAWREGYKLELRIEISIFMRNPSYISIMYLKMKELPWFWLSLQLCGVLKLWKHTELAGRGGKSQFLKCWLLHITLTSLSLFTPVINYTQKQGLLLMFHQHPFTT